MFNRLLQKRQCLSRNSIALSSSMRINIHKQSRHNICSSSSISKSIHINNVNSSLYLHQFRYFGKKIKVYNQPDVGEGTVEVDILEWLVKEGDTVSALQTIGRGKYEKADVDILAPTYDGTVHKILVEAGSVAIVGKGLVEFEVEDDGTSDSTGESKAQNIDSSTMLIIMLFMFSFIAYSHNIQIYKNRTKQTSKSNISTKGILALPATKHFAKENNIDLSLVTGTGKDGRILKEDVMEFMASGNTQKQSTETPKAQKTPSIITTETKTILSALKEDKIEKVFGVKKAMVKKMTEANAVPQFGYSDEVILNELVSLRKELKPMGELYGVKITYLPFILKAISLALMNPQSTCLNAYINANCTELTHKGCHNIGVAIDSSEGLIVPNIKFVEQKSVMEIAKDLEALIMRGKNNQITNDDITGGTITLSNIGAIGGTYCRPICFVPEVCIGAIGAIKKFPRYNEKNEIFQASVMAMSWSADHRVIDGATVARFANDVKMYLEKPTTMLMHLK